MALLIRLKKNTSGGELRGAPLSVDLPGGYFLISNGVMYCTSSRERRVTTKTPEGCWLRCR
jgi:hypothetical protein